MHPLDRLIQMVEKAALNLVGDMGAIGRALSALLDDQDIAWLVDLLRKRYPKP